MVPRLMVRPGVDGEVCEGDTRVGGVAEESVRCGDDFGRDVIEDAEEGIF